MEFEEFCGFLEKIEAEPSRNAMVATLAELFSRTDKSEMMAVVYLLQGVVAPPFKGIEFGMGEKLLMKAIVRAYSGKKEILKSYRKLGDLGLVAEELRSKGRQDVLILPGSELPALSVIEVYSDLKNLALQAGTSSQEKKLGALMALFGRCREPKEARYLARIPLSKLRLGIGDPTILDALSTRFSGDKSLREMIERAYNVRPDLGEIGKVLLSEGVEGLSKMEITPRIPVRPALAERLNSGEEIIGKIGPCLVEAKYDGFRAQVHKDGGAIEIFSRSLERTTEMFPEIVAAVRRLPHRQMIFEGEALAYDKETRRFLPFQETIQRKRKHGIAGFSKKHPLRMFAFDLLFLDGIDYTALPFKERRSKLEEIFGGSAGGLIEPSEAVEAKDGSEIDDFFESCVGKGLEGIIAKDPAAKYTAGARKFAWIKMKRSYTQAGLADTIDAVIIGYFTGKGQRAGFGFGGLLVAVLEKDGTYKSIAKVGSGFSEEQMSEFAKMLKGERTEGKPKDVDSRLEPDFWVRPKYVITIAADEITRSPVHTAGSPGEGGTGFALRFPRMKGRVRTDKGPQDATTVGEIRDLFALQEKKRTEQERRKND